MHKEIVRYMLIALGRNAEYLYLTYQIKFAYSTVVINDNLMIYGIRTILLMIVKDRTIHFLGS